MKPSKTIPIVIMAFAVLATGLFAVEAGRPAYAPGELIVKLEHGIINWQGFEETPITHVPIRQPQLAAALQEGGVRSVERVFKSIFATPPFQFTTKRGKQVQFEDLSQVYLLKMDGSLDMELVAEQMEQLPGVIYAEPNYIYTPCTELPSDPDFERHPLSQPWEYQ